MRESLSRHSKPNFAWPPRRVTGSASYWGSDALAATSCSIVVTDATAVDNPIIYANAAFGTLTGYTLAEIVGRNCRFLQGPDTDGLAMAEMRAAIAAGIGFRREVLNYRKDGTPFWNDLTIDPIRDPDGRVTGFIGIQYPVDEAHLAQEAKAEAETRLASIADHIPGYIYRRVMRTNGTIEVVYLSPWICKLLGLNEAEAVRTFYDHIHPDDQANVLAAVRRSAAEMSIFREEYRLLSSSGAVHWLRSDAPPRRMANGEIIWDGLAFEISAEKRWESEIANRALRDPLTGLLTRAAWRQALAMQLEAANGDTGRCGLVYIDIDAFRALNEGFGQPVGDEILRETARRLSWIAESVAGVAGRLGGDEFAILVPACADKDALSFIARSLGEVLGFPIDTGAQQMTIRTCVGATLCADRTTDEPPGNDLASELMAQAELALRWAKQAGCSAHMLYTPANDDRFRNQAILAGSLGQAITQRELELHYQPLVDLASGRIVSAEALVRWNHPTLGMQRPDLFIPMAEKSGLIVPLGRWVMEQTMRQQKLWQEAGLMPPRIAFNVSGIQLTEPGFVAAVEESLRRSRANATDFEIELTEGLLIEPSPQILATLHALRTMGLMITIDDFGSGHASFSYLRDFPVDKLKIDQVFVRKLVLESTDALIIRAVISLARNLGIKFVAEGIETRMQRDFLLREGCEIGQGYLFSMPLVAEDFGWLLANDVRLPLHAPAEPPVEEEDSKVAPDMQTGSTF